MNKANHKPFLAPPAAIQTMAKDTGQPSKPTANRKSTAAPDSHAEALATKIKAEAEWQPSTAALRDAILRRFTDRLDAIAQNHPEALGQALAVVIQAGPGREVLVLSDPATADLVTELRRHAEAPETAASPLTALLQARLPI